jgi:hypothetical protein
VSDGKNRGNYCTWHGCYEPAIFTEMAKSTRRVWARLCVAHAKEYRAAKVDPDRVVFVRATLAAAGFDERGRRE